jgi:Flp pilus assembly protein TadD/Tol biopolymer transport system component
VRVLAGGLFLVVIAFARAGDITVDYPAAGSVFPPDITPPTFLWRESPDAADSWVIDISFADHSAPIKVKSAGERMHTGEIDPEAVAPSNEPPKLTPEQASAHTWMPDDETWEAIKKRSMDSPATVRITGYEEGRQVSQGMVTIVTSRDPVGAPIFYRDVPLMPNQSEKGVVKPLPSSAIVLIKWRLRYVNERQSHVVMERPATCANCHSFSLDGKTLGLDVDGPQNDRGLYALVNLSKQTVIRNQDVIKWPAVRDPKVERLRAAFMSQVSPDGKYVLTTIDDPDASKRVSGRTLEDKYYNANFMDYKFLQVFYPTRGILAWYDRENKRLEPLHGADDPKYVQTDGVWSPDGKWVVFARAQAESPYPPGAKMAAYANDPNETQIRYELYRMPFNEGRGGTPERIAGASQNGMSNNFPKVSRDGKWIVFVRCRNGQLMRPDSKLYIVPFEGGEARLMKCNTRLMNSWHTFSPNGKWMAFSSKARSPYTQMYLTHIDEKGNDSPSILIDNSTAANRAVNLPEFVNIPPGGLEKIETPATEFYKLFNTAIETMKKERFDEAVPQWSKALELNPDDGKAHFNMGYSLFELGRLDQAIEEYRKACDLDPEDAVAQANLALALAQKGKLDEAIAHYRKSLALAPGNPMVHADLGVALFDSGQPADAVDHLRKAIELDPENAETRNKFGSILAKTGRLDEGLEQLQKAVALNPNSVEYQFNLGYVLGLKGSYAEAVPHMEKAVELSGGKEWQSLSMLGAAYYQAGRRTDAVQAAQRALEVAVRQNNTEAARNLRATIEQYQR